MSFSIVFNILAVVLFLVAMVLVLIMTPPDWNLIWVLLFGGLASHSASHLPI